MICLFFHFLGVITCLVPGWFYYLLLKEWKYTAGLTRKELTPQSEPYMRENAKSEWERQCGREGGRENHDMLEGMEWGNCSPLGCPMHDRELWRVLRKLKQTSGRAETSMKTREGARWRLNGIWFTIQGHGSVIDETTVKCLLHWSYAQLLTIDYHVVWHLPASAPSGFGHPVWPLLTIMSD